MKSKKAEIVRRVHALPEVSFEDHRLTSFAGLVLFMALFRRLRLARRLRRCFAAVDRERVFGLARVVLQLIVHVLRRLPEGYLIIGDAMCSFDATFAQGMTVAALQAEQLGKRAHPERSSVRLQRRLYRLTDMSFELTSAEAHLWRETVGWKPRSCAVLQSSLARVFEAANHDPVVFKALIRVMHFLASPATLLRPRILLRVLARSRAQQAAIPQPASAFVGELASRVASQSGF